MKCFIELLDTPSFLFRCEYALKNVLYIGYINSSSAKQINGSMICFYLLFIFCTYVSNKFKIVVCQI